MRILAVAVVERRVVDDIGDVGDIGDVRDVDLAHIARAGGIAGHVDFARREREPADGRTGAADGDGDVDARPAHPGHQRRRIDRPCRERPRRPAPGVAVVDPAAVMERREAPGRIVDPGPAPRTHPGPMTAAVRSPAAGDGARVPDGAVVGALLPAAVAVEVLRAGHLGRDVALRAGDPVFAALALAEPACEGIAHRLGQAVLRHAIAFEPELAALAAVDGERAAAAFEGRLACVHRDMARAIEAVEAIAPGGLNAETPFQCRHLELADGAGIADAHGGRAVVKLQGHPVVVEAQHFEFAACVQAQRRRAERQFDPPAGVGGETIAARHRTVPQRRDPLAGIGAVQPYLAVGFGDAGDAVRRVAVGRMRRHGADGAQGCGHRQHEAAARVVQSVQK